MTIPALKIFVERLKTSFGEITIVPLHYKIRVLATSALSYTWENGSEHLTSFRFCFSLFCYYKYHCGEHPYIYIFWYI